MAGFDYSNVPEKLRPPVPIEEVTPPPENLYDSLGHRRATVNAKELKYTEINGYGYYPAREFFYDREEHMRGFLFPEGTYGKGFDENCILWKVPPEEFKTKGPYIALIKFIDEKTPERMHVADGKYDTELELPTAEGMLFFEKKLSDAIIEPKETAERIKKEGLFAVRKYIPALINDENDPLLEEIIKRRDGEETPRAEQ